MKQLIAFLLACILSFGTLSTNMVSAQAAETIWMETDKDSYNAGETVIVTLQAISATPFQGFTFKLRYDPACLEPSVPGSRLAGLNYMPVPQKAGLVSGIFANTSPLTANGALAEVKFKILTSCQSTLNLENATLNASDASGLPVSIQGIGLGTSSLLISTGGAQALAPEPASTLQATPAMITPSTTTSSLPKSDPTSESAGTPGSSNFSWLLIPGLIILIGLIFVVVVAVFILRRRALSNSDSTLLLSNPTLTIKRGPDVGRVLPLLSFPCRIGSHPGNEIVLEDKRISAWQAEILADQHGYTLVDLGSSPDGTFLNGKPLINQQSTLLQADTLRLGGILLVFGQKT